MSNIRGRLKRLEARLNKRGACPVCRDGQAAEVVTVRHGDAATPIRSCPRCGRRRRQVAILLFGDKPSRNNG